MIIIRDLESLQNELEKIRESGSRLGFVPTMGALHSGHLSLISQSAAKNEYTVLSIFVNPTQFNESLDFKNYPRNEEADLHLLKDSGVTHVFLPSTEMMYPAGETAPNIELDGLDLPMEGAHRPGHFKGVVTIVNKFFSLIRPDKAYFGQKDFQQLAIVKLLAKKLHPSIAIVGCPIIREAGGLAMSSRNALLNDEEKRTATGISSTLFALSADRKKMTPEQLKMNAVRSFSKWPMQLEYLEIADAETLQPVSSWSSRKAVACIAARLGNVRLIDNIELRA